MKKKKLIISSILGIFSAFSCSRSNDFVPSYTSSAPISTQYTDDQLVTMVQKDVLKYFWDYAEPNSKLARERYDTDQPSTDATTITTGGSGFGLMTILVGVKNGYVSRQEAVSRLTTALSFLTVTSRFHGAWPHWINGSTSNVQPFSALDNGGDLVETSYLAEGLICIREYFKNSTDVAELALSKKADTLWKEIEWNWYKIGRAHV